MVCHESYKDNDGNWLYPDEIEKISSNEAIKKQTKKKLTLGLLSHVKVKKIL